MPINKTNADGGNGYGLPEYTLPSGYRMGAGGSSQTNTTQNKEELEEVTIERIVDDFIESDNQKLFRNQCVRDLKELLSQAHQSGIEEERKRIGKELSDEMALFIKQWSYEQYGKRYLGNKALGYQRIEGVVIDLDQRINKVLKGESLKENK